MTNLNDFDSAVRVKEAVRSVAKAAMQEVYSPPRYAQVVSLPAWTATVELQYPGEDTTFIVPFPGSIFPLDNTSTVRVAGAQGDRYIEDVFGISQLRLGNASWFVHADYEGFKTFAAGTFSPNSRWSSSPLIESFTSSQLRVLDNDLEVTIGFNTYFRVDGVNGAVDIRAALDIGIGLLDDYALDLHGLFGAAIRFYDGNSLNGQMRVDSAGAMILNSVTGGVLVYTVNDIETFRVGASLFLLGKSSSSINTAGVEMTTSGKIWSILEINDANIICNKFDLAVGASVVFESFRLTNSVIGTITRNASTSAVLYNTTSDERLKTVVGWASNDEAIAKMMELEFKRYYRNDDPEQTVIPGLIAQQAYDVDASFVTPGGSDTDTEPWMIDYGQMSILYGGALQGTILHLVQAMEDVKSLDERLIALESAK